ncbi:hypothetical protein MMC16_000968 [Acarospora aff. strigata]|nr:hypothetical protein [Acarospora aff. strigata]
MTLAGLNTINLSTLNTFQQVVLFVLIMLGSAILVSSAVVHVRRKAFEKRFQSLVDEERRNKRTSRRALEGKTSFPISLIKSRSMARRTSTSRELPSPEVDGVVVRGRAIAVREDPTEVKTDFTTPGTRLAYVGNPGDAQVVNPETSIEYAIDSTEEGPKDLEAAKSESRFATDDHIRFVDSATLGSPASPMRQRRHSRLLSMQGVGARPDIMNHPRRATLSPTVRMILDRDVEKDEPGLQGTIKYFPSSGFIGRNSQFHSLTLADRERLGGVEYKAVTLLAIIVPVYFVLWQLLGLIGLGAYVASGRADITLQNGLNPWWVGAFNAVSAFNNSGMSLLDANMVVFQDSVYMLLTMGLLILAGNTAYPLFLRLILWSLKKLLPDTQTCRDQTITLDFLLEHPRRCYTNLFPSAHSWWLLGSIVLLNGIDWVAFEVFNIGNPSIASLPRGTRVLDGLFQALAVRSGGFYVVSISQLRIGLLVLYVIMMYISAYPVLITLRNSNVYEERSLGIYADDPTEKIQDRERDSFFKGVRRRLNAHGSPKESRGYFVRQQLRAQIAHDIWILVLAVLFITITETSQFERDPVNFSVFNILFEVVSAYGTVGISVGLPNVAYSFCGGWHTLSKLILCFVMIRGRHRGLPVAIDRAVLLPGEHLAAAEEEDAQIRLERTISKGHRV